MSGTFKILVGAIPIRNGTVLLLQRSERETFMPGAWGLPCGKIDFGEDLQQAVLRELKEETGLTGTVQRLCGYSTFMSTKGRQALHNLQLNFVVAADTGDVILDESSQAFRWISLSDFRDAGLDDFTVNTIAQYFEV
jgi:8-oxo-dGTP diphosphatase